MSLLKIRDGGLWRSERWQIIPPLPDPDPDPPPAGFGHGANVTTSIVGISGLGLVPGDLTPSGSISTSSDGQVIEGKDVSGSIQVNHHNVTIRGCRITAPVSVHAIKANYRAGTQIGVGGLLVEYCEMRGPITGSNGHGFNAIRNTSPTHGPNTIRRCFIHELGHTTHPSAGTVIIENYMRTGPVFQSYHNDGVYCAKATNTHNPSVAVVRNKIIMANEDGSSFGGTAAVYFNTISGDVHNVNIIDNWLQCTRVTVSVNFEGQHPSGGGDLLGTLTITGNKIVQGWPVADPGPEFAMTLDNTSPGTVVRSGNRFVDISGTDLGPVPGG
jgi:hypothetical protein